jgi:hypothetical protein
MSRALITRETNTVIVTDRVIVPEQQFNREWSLQDKLTVLALPVGFKNIDRPILVVVNKIQHLSVLTDIAVALVIKQNADAFDLGQEDVRAIRNCHARKLIGEASTNLYLAFKSGDIDIEVFQKMGRLLDVGLIRPQFSKDWEYASLLYSTMTIDSLKCFEAEMQQMIFMKPLRSPDTVRQDRNFGRQFYRQLLAGEGCKLINAPSNHQKDLTEKYINATAPYLLGSTKLQLNVDLGDVSMAKPRQVMVNKKGKKINSVNLSQRRFKESKISALPLGFFGNQDA